MTRLELIAQLNWLNRNGIWLITRDQFRLIFRGEAEGAQSKALVAHVKAGLLTHLASGLYANPNSTVPIADPLLTVAQYLRPTDSAYISLEYALHLRGALSQIPSRLTLMTTGRSHTFETPFGTIEFVHTNRSPENFPGDPDDALPVADVATAIRDMRRSGRKFGSELAGLDDALVTS